MKTEVYSWRVSAERKAELEEEARREGTSLSALLDRVTADWLAERRTGQADDEAEQAAIRKRAMAAIGSIRGSDPTRSARASELVREILARKRAKESHAFARRSEACPRAPAGLIDTGAILALVDRDDEWHASCVVAYNRCRLPLADHRGSADGGLPSDPRNRRSNAPVWMLLRSGAVVMAISQQELPQIQTLMDHYADRPMDFADATLVYLAARETSV